jgi:hypothetical protein
MTMWLWLSIKIHVISFSGDGKEGCEALMYLMVAVVLYTDLILHILQIKMLMYNILSST